HLDVLKIATSREISNDAMDLALMINDNTVFDTTGVALKAYSKAELLLIQNRQDQALAKLDSLEKAIVDKSLTDEIYWLRAKIFKSRRQWQPTLDNYKRLIESYSEGLYGDDALYFSALIYEEELGEKEKAMELYTEFLKKHPGSIYLVEVRKRFRKLRGDEVN
ncbi:MAG: tetratricopeptide repeat protein, partial [Flexibacteraceae bacterium]